MKPVQRRRLAETGLAPHVDATVCADDAEAFQPDDRPFDAVDAVDADEYVMVGDNVDYDVRPAAERGYRTVFVGRADDGDPDDGVADHHVADPADLPSLPTLLAS